MSEKENRFPKIKKSIRDFIDDEDGSITRSKLISVGSMVLLMTIFAGIEAYAAHSSHKSHSSHSSHSSSSSGNAHGSHSSHESHSSHVSSSSTHSNHSNHASHSSHSSHANTATHSNSRYSDEGDIAYGPDAADVPTIETPQSTEPYAEMTMADEISITMPTLSDVVTVNEIQPTDFEKTD